MSLFIEIRFKGTEKEKHSQWLEARKEGIGGSDAAAVMGMSKYSTPLTVWLEKTGREEPQDLSDKEPVYWGKTLEDVVAKEFQKRHPELKVKRKNALLRSKKYPWMQASVDRVVTDSKGRKGILEIKTCDKQLAKDWEEDVPDYYVPQPTHYLAVTGYEFHYVAVLIGGNHYKDYYSERDEADIQALIEREDQFWNEYVRSGVMPQVTGLQADSEALSGMYPNPSEELKPMLDFDLLELDELENLKVQKSEIDEQIKTIENGLKAIIGDYKGIETPTRKIAWIRTEATTFNKKRFASDNPELYERYTEKKPKNMGLRITEVKNG